MIRLMSNAYYTKATVATSGNAIATFWVEYGVGRTVLIELMNFILFLSIKFIKFCSIYHGIGHAVYASYVAIKAFVRFVSLQ